MPVDRWLSLNLKVTIDLHLAGQPQIGFVADAGEDMRSKVEAIRSGDDIAAAKRCDGRPVFATPPDCGKRNAADERTRIHVDRQPLFPR